MVTGARAASVEHAVISGRGTRVALAVLTAVSSAPAFAFAQDEAAPAPPAPTIAPTSAPADEESGHERTLKGHVFIFPAYVASGIVVSYIGLRLRLSLSSVSAVPTPIGPTDITAVTVSEGLDLGIKIADWVAVFATGGVRSLVSTSLRGLVYEGATYDIGAYAGALFRLFRSERTGSQLSARVGGGYTRGQVMTLFPIFDQPVQSVADLLQGNLREAMATPFNTITYDGTLAYTQGFSRLFGLQVSAGFGGTHLTTEPFDRVRARRSSTTASNFTYAFAVAPSFDFNAFKVPVAVMPEYVLLRRASTAQLRDGGDIDTAHLFALGVYYSGRVNLQLGLLWAIELGQHPLRTPQGTSDSPVQNGGEFVLRYVW